MDFCLREANIAAYDTKFQKETFLIAKKVQEFVFMKQHFIDKLESLVKEDELNIDERLKFEKVLKNDMESFLICYQLFRKFGNDFYFMEPDTMKFSILSERNKTERFLKDVEKHKILTSRLLVLSKTYVKL